MKTPTFPKIVWTLNFWETDLPEFGALIMIQLLLTTLLWVIISNHVLCLSGISEPGKAFNLLRPIVWLVIVGTGVVAVWIHILFASILYKGVQENGGAHVAVWLLYVFIGGTGVIIQFLYLTPSMWVNVGLGALMSLVFPQVLCGLRSIHMRKGRELILSTGHSIILKDKDKGPSQLEVEVVVVV